MKLTFKHIISEDIRDNSKIEGAIYKVIEKLYKRDRNSGDRPYVLWNSIGEEIASIFGMDYFDVIFFMFKWAIAKKMDPFEEFGMELDSVASSEEGVDFLKRTGWWDKYFDLKQMGNFHDIRIDKKGKITLYADVWEEFADLFEHDQTYGRALSEDYEDFFDSWSESFNTIWEDINDKNILDILESLPSHADELDPYGIPEVLDDFADEETGLVPITRRLINFIKDNNTSEILEELIEENSALSDLKHDIKSAYNISYNDAAQSELFNSAKEELEELFEGKIDWCKRPGPDDSVFTDLCVTISEEKLTEWIERHIDIYSEFPVTNYGTLLGMIRDILNEDNKLLGSINLDYWFPDSDKAQEYFNDILPDYLYMST